MRLLLDQGRSSASLLREAGIDAVHVGEIGYANAEDAAILEKGRQDNRVIVTLDADFHAILALTNVTSPSVIRVRIEGLRGIDFFHLLQKIHHHWGDALEQGAVLSVQQNRIRVRHLPLS
jgi:predicted nuclease of predicted toxin-antitoxin system